MLLFGVLLSGSVDDLLMCVFRCWLCIVWRGLWSFAIAGVRCGVLFVVGCAALLLVVRCLLRVG